jgi:hypothetical protein
MFSVCFFISLILLGSPKGWVLRSCDQHIDYQLWCTPVDKKVEFRSWNSLPSTFDLKINKNHNVTISYKLGNGEWSPERTFGSGEPDIFYIKNGPHEVGIHYWIHFLFIDGNSGKRYSKSVEYVIVKAKYGNGIRGDDPIHDE